MEVDLWNNVYFDLPTNQTIFNSCRVFDISIGIPLSVTPGIYRIIDDFLCRIWDEVPPIWK